MPWVFLSDESRFGTVRKIATVTAQAHPLVAMLDVLIPIISGSQKWSQTLPAQSGRGFIFLSRLRAIVIGGSARLRRRILRSSRVA